MVVFYLLGDMGSGNEEQISVADALSEHIKKNPAKTPFICGLGDNIYEEGCYSVDDKQFIKKFEIPYKDINNKIKFYMCLGNHDYGNTLFNKKGNSLNQIEYGILSQKNGKKWVMPNNYYTFNKGDIAFFILDTNFNNHSKDEINTQYEYFVDEINKSKKKWKILIGHHTLRSIGGHGNADERMKSFFYRLLDVCDFDLYICGHDHNKQVINTTLNNKKITLIVCGTGGKKYHKDIHLNNVDKKDIYFHSPNLGYAYCVLKGNHLYFDFFDNKNQFEYRHSLKK
tara:strand:+ start:161 stop:1012 length:852 start_codon:yes stop_codon:yes gene_type:complete